jgi:hypothetical protein
MPARPSSMPPVTADVIYVVDLDEGIHPHRVRVGQCPVVTSLPSGRPSPSVSAFSGSVPKSCSRSSESPSPSASIVRVSVGVAPEGDGTSVGVIPEPVPSFDSPVVIDGRDTVSSGTAPDAVSDSECRNETHYAHPPSNAHAFCWLRSSLNSSGGIFSNESPDSGIMHISDRFVL